MSINDKLLAIQSQLKAPKGQLNKFGGYHYRSCEDILEALKPLLAEQKCTLTLTDEIKLIGTRYYVEATATLNFNDTSIAVSACAREAETKKGMDDSQITGAASSYARKYALNGLFCIDDTKDADTMDNTKSEPSAKKPTAAAAPSTAASPSQKRAAEAFGASAEQVRRIASLAADLGMDVAKEIYEPMKITSQPSSIQAKAIIERLEAKLKETLDAVALL